MSAKSEETAHHTTAEQDDTQASAANAPREPAAGKTPRQNAGRVWLFRLIALVVIPALLLLLFELTLRIVGFGYPTGFARKTQVNDRSVYVRNTDFHRRFFPRGLGRSPTPFEIPTNKPPGTYRVFILGASAAKGTPEPSFGFGRILEVQLRERFPEVNFELVNCAATAINSHVVLEIARDCAKLEPDLFIVYLGNNEVVGPFGAGTVLTPFSPSLPAIRAGLKLRSTRIGQLLDTLLTSASNASAPRRWQGMRMFLDNQVPADDPALEVVYEHFKQNLSDLCHVAEKSNVPVMLCTVATNLKDCPPFASQHRPNITEEQKTEWNVVYEQGTAFETSGNYAQAVEQYFAAAEIDDRYADLHYRLGRCYWALEDYQSARRHFLDARRLDTLRFRADTRINDIIRTVASSRSTRGTRLVDAEKTFEGHSPRAVPGDEFFHEHVHMDFSGNYLLAAAVFQDIEKILPEWITKTAPASMPPLTETQCAARLAHTVWDRYQITDKVLNSFINEPPFTNQLYHDRLVDKLEKKLDELRITDNPESPRQVDTQYREAIARNPSDIWLRFNYAVFLLSASDNLDVIQQQLSFCLESLPDDAGLFNKLALALAERGLFDQAKRFFDKALRLSPENVGIRANLAETLARAGRLDEAFREFDTAIRLDPENPTTYLNLGAVCRLHGKPDEAIRNYRRALEIQPDFTPALTNLAAVLLSRGNVDEAIEHLRRVLRINPDDAATHHSLAVALRSRGKLRDAIRHFRAALATSPDKAKTHYRLGVTLAETGRIKAALEHLRTAVKLKPDRPAPLTDLAWILATCRDPTIRNGNEAVILAERACPAGNCENPRFLDVLAAAYAEVGRFPNAVETALKAIAQTAQEKRHDLAERQRRLTLYESGEPYRPTPGPAP